MGNRAQLIIIEAFEALEIIEGETPYLPFSFKADDGRLFMLWPRYGLSDLASWFKQGKLTVEIIKGGEQTKERRGWLGDLKRLSKG
jgi:hypothetical protein